MFFFSTTEIQHFEQKVDAYVQPLVNAQQFSGAILFAKDGKILLHKAYGMSDYEKGIPTNVNTKFRLCSVSKQFVALAILLLQKSKKLNIKDSVTRYFPEYVQYAKITIEDLLKHTSGIPNYTKFDEFKENFFKNSHSITDIIALFKDKPLKFIPGTEFEYSDSGYVLLANLIEKTSGQSYESYLQENIFKKLDMNSSGCSRETYFTQEYASGYQTENGELKRTNINMANIAGAGDLYSTIDDLFIWHQKALSLGIFNNDLIQQMIHPQIETTNFFDNPWYGYGIFTASINEVKCLGHFGRLIGYHTLFLHFPTINACLIILSNIQQSPIEGMAQYLLSLLN